MFRLKSMPGSCPNSEERNDIFEVFETNRSVFRSPYYLMCMWTRYTAQLRASIAEALTNFEEERFCQDYFIQIPPPTDVLPALSGGAFTQGAHHISGARARSHESSAFRGTWCLYRANRKILQKTRIHRGRDR